MRARKVNRKIWEENVIKEDGAASQRASSVSLRAEHELQETGSYLDETHHDVVSEVQETIANINATC